LILALAVFESEASNVVIVIASAGEQDWAYVDM